MSSGDSKLDEKAAIPSVSENGAEFDEPPSPAGETSTTQSRFDTPQLSGDIESSATAQRLRDAKGLIEQRLAEGDE